MAYPSPVTEQPLVTPVGHPMNIRTSVNPPAVESWDYFAAQSQVRGARMHIFNTIATPWWASTDPPTL